MNKEKPLDVDEYLVAIKTGINNWFILSGRENMVELKEAEEYAECFEGQFPVAILQVKKVYNTKT
jgi:hypothetical protein